MSAFQMLVSAHESLKPHFHHRHQGLTYVQINIIHHTAKINLPVQGMSFFLFLKVLEFSPNIMFLHIIFGENFSTFHWTNLLNLCRCFYCSGNQKVLGLKGWKIGFRECYISQETHTWTRSCAEKLRGFNTFFSYQI